MRRFLTVFLGIVLCLQTSYRMPCLVSLANEETQTTGNIQDDSGEKEEKESEDGEKETILLGTVWEGPYNYDNTPEEKKETKEFAFAEEGICEALDWFNEKGKEYNGNIG